MGVDARQLRYFLAVVEHGTMTKAAEAMHVSQPSLSQAIVGLERELRTQLFHRTGRGLVLSAAGQAALEPARRVVHGLAEVASAVEPVRELSGGRLDLVVQHLLSGWGVAVVAAFCHQYPQVAVRMIEPPNWHRIGRTVRTGTCELGLCTLPITGGEGLHTRQLASRELHIALPANHPLADDEGPLEPAALVDQRFVTSPPRTVWRTLLEEVLEETGRSPVAAVEITANSGAIPLVVAGVGVAVVAGQTVHQAREQGAVVRPLRTDVRMRVGVVHRPGPLSPAAEALIALLERDE